MGRAAGVLPRSSGVSPKAASARPPAHAAAAERTRSFPVVGVGASAGGLEAFTELLQHLPTDTGMAFVLVQHLDPTHPSILRQLLARTATLPIAEVQNDMSLQPNHIFVLPPNSEMTVSQGVLKLVQGRRKEGAQHSIDHFLESLAHDRGPLAIGVILSGSASDGTAGLEAIKAEGGITFAQDDSAKYEGMPRSAIAARTVDFVLSPASIAAELGRIARHPHLLPAEPSGDGDSAPDTSDYRQIVHLLRMRTGVDFSLYKPPTIQRRITRRMALNRMPRLSDYLKHLRGHPAEVEALYQDVLVSFTEFFRNPEAFDALKQHVFPELIAKRTPNQPVRVWVAGCSAGQEVYSVAMVFLEFAAQAATQIRLQVFGTDVNNTLLEKARNGFYSKSEVRDLSPERLRRFFVEQNGGFHISKPIREQCVFAKHDLLADPPFSKMDLVSCRNVMIYLQPAQHKRLLPIFHYALKPGGFLLLGNSETIGEFGGLFSIQDKSCKLYDKNPSAMRPALKLQPKRTRQEQVPAAPAARPLVPERTGEFEAQREADRTLLANYAPAGVLVNEALDVIQFRGHTGPFLEHPPGRASYNLPKMLREGLLMPVRSAIQEARKTGARARVEQVEFRSDHQTRRASIEVLPVKNLKEPWFLVLFEPVPASGSAPRKVEPLPLEPLFSPDLEAVRRENAGLRNELASTREHMQSVSEQYEAANEELQAANEESQSNNEELQSINEELETTKEELESTNEELTTVNEEMANRNTELNRLNSDLNNVLNGVELCIVVLGGDLCVRRFTPLAEKLLNLMPADLGRPIANIRPNFDFPDLEPALREVVHTLRPHYREVQDKAGRWYSLRILPYNTLDHKVDGAVLVMVDIDALKRGEQRLQAALDYAEAIIETVREPLLVLDDQLRIQRANQAFYQAFRLSPEDVKSKLIHEIGGGQWRIPRLRSLLEEVLSTNTPFNDFEVEHNFDRMGPRTMVLNARPIRGSAGRQQLILLAIEDFTERKQLQDRVKERTARLREMVEELEAFSYSVSHDLRSPLRAMLGYADLALRQAPKELDSQVKSYLQKIAGAATRADQLVCDVLTYSQVSRANLLLAPIDIEKLLREKIIPSSPQFQPPQADVQLGCPLLKVIGHEASLQRCLANLLSNATKFVLPGHTPRVKIWTEPRDGQVRIWVEDNGIGIAPADLSRIFNMFERIHSAHEFEGTGIGLAIVRKSAERMGGSAGVESEPGTGSKFWIQLPGPP